MKVLSFNLLLLLSLCCMRIYAVQLVSVYPQRPDDREAFYFTPENYGIRADGRTDVSDAQQSAINQVKKEKNFGILFIPEGKYRISKTIIPHYFDLSRCSSLLEARPGHPFYTADEYDRRMVQMDVATDGTLSNLRYFIDQGEFGSTVDSEGNLYVAVGEIYIFDRDGNRKGMIQVPERPSTLQFGGKNGRTLFITGRKGLYGWEQTQ